MGAPDSYSVRRFSRREAVSRRVAVAVGAMGPPEVGGAARGRRGHQRSEGSPGVGGVARGRRGHQRSEGPPERLKGPPGTRGVIGGAPVRGGYPASDFCFSFGEALCGHVREFGVSRLVSKVHVLRRYSLEIGFPGPSLRTPRASARGVGAVGPSRLTRSVFSPGRPRVRGRLHYCQC
jgi:hypothetical protein